MTKRKSKPAQGLTKKQMAANKFRAKVDAAAAPLLAVAHAAGDHDTISHFKKSNDPFGLCGDDECVYCGEKGCVDINVHGPEYDEQQEFEQRCADEAIEQKRIDLAHYTAAREVVKDFWSVDSSKVLSRLEYLAEDVARHDGIIFQTAKDITSLMQCVRIGMVALVGILAAFVWVISR